MTISKTFTLSLHDALPICHISVLANDTVEQQLHFASHRLPQRIVEVRKEHRDWTHSLQTAQVQPLSGKVDRECFCLGMFQHAPHLLFQHDRVSQLSLTRDPK